MIIQYRVVRRTAIKPAIAFLIASGVAVSLVGLFFRAAGKLTRNGMKKNRVGIQRFMESKRTFVRA